MEFRVLGSLAAVADGATAALGPPKQRALLAALILHVGEIVSVDRLTEMLWGAEAPRTASHSIQIYVSDLRKALEPMGGPELIRTRAPGYLLDADRDSIDAWRFERLVRDGARMLDAGEREQGREALRRALGLWRGPALSDFAYEEFAQTHIRRLTDLHLDAIEILADAELDAGRTADALELLATAVREDPLRERSRELLMLALYRSGRHADALRTFGQLQAQLADELGIDPSPRIRALYDRILLHDPGLLQEVRESPQAAGIRNPYKGLRSFTEQDAADFFGRDRLVGQLLDVLGSGATLVSLVGPSGSGKTSVVAAGVLPQLRAGRIPGSAAWRIGWLVPGTNPRKELEAALRPGADLLVIDQFEQVFAAAADEEREQFLRLISEAVGGTDPNLRVILNLRADYYDRPLLSPAFAAVFTPSVVNVMPMTADELEAAIVEPADRVGVEVERALLAELVADTADRPGSLPLLQYAMTELFEGRSGTTMTRAGFAKLGGLRGLLSRDAERLFGSLGSAGQSAAMQVFLRLVRAGSGVAQSRRRVLVGELTDLPIDPVVLSEVLTTFGRHRLLTFDRDATSGQATVEVAHEALLAEWERLAGWIERHRVDLRRHEALVVAAEEWEASGRNPDYVFGGSRLREYEPWLDGGIMQLSGRERAFLEAGLELRRSGEAIAAARAEIQRRLERRARARLIGLGGVVALLAAAVTFAALVGLGRPPARVGLSVWGGGTLDQIISSGFDRGVTDFGLTAKKVIALDLADPEADWEPAVRALVEESPALMVLTNLPAFVVNDFVRDYPNVRFAAVDVVASEPNVESLSFAEAEGAFLAGVAAARTSKTGTIGFVGGMEFEVIWRFHAGYEAGARAYDPDIQVLVAYLSEDDPSGFQDAAGALSAARQMYSSGADVILHAAGDAGLGVFEAAADMSAGAGRQLWVIGVDTDQHETVTSLPGALRAAAWQPHILTSVVKRLDQAVYLALRDVAEGRFVAGPRGYGLASGLLDLSYSGGFIDGIRPEIERYKAQIVAGAIPIPCVPSDRLEAAREQGISPADCGAR